MSLYSGPLDEEDQDAILLDARAGDIESLQEVFSIVIDPKSMVTCRDSSSKSTALHYAAGNGHLEMTKYILKLAKETTSEEKFKEFVDEKNENGNTALHWASLNGHLEVVKLLCDEYDADPFIKNKFDHDAIFEAENNGKEEVETYFLKKFDVEPLEDETVISSKDIATVDNIGIKEGTEIANMTNDATEALREKTETLNIE
ncbi:hypothetical protein TPHA_0H01910 [Tetrapisispora phaffii CBS 4417]|uniref:Uncharacterized protein n=1 Tax=Tetrapisispora phaffii (strain ATCC 24235 / CBS 4417 / NBRC 1672 / NRRL Y-8282 / UCD 70-5) TaxID=1071381 RepID=G8BWE5_TETPH|nr:hypothetical protein TPHA_0H01910 [Tetrapisispora phaffii CBS 4417]CCE64396.1 hypothetical protein TPHA_0H01910 [Tetrapisispora phaffii CBS 4417]